LLLGWADVDGQALCSWPAPFYNVCWQEPVAETTPAGEFHGQRREPVYPRERATPPYLAGREAEQSVFGNVLNKVLAGRSPDADIVMYGPRGVGKTVLLNWVRHEIPETAGRDGAAHASRVVPDDLSSSPSAVWEWLLPGDIRRRLLPDRIQAGVGGTSATWELTEALSSECKKTPRMLLVDEAHTLDSALCRHLLNLSQKVRNEGAPFLLVLAGTPSLPSFLDDVNATFCERSVIIGISRLDAESTAQAIRQPLLNDDVEIDAEALEDAAKDSQHYPYFIQLWGKALWDAAKDAELTRLTPGKRRSQKPMSTASG